MSKGQQLGLTVQCSPHQNAGLETNRLMLLVIAACIPGLLVSTFFFGIGTLLNIALAMLSALVFEGLALKLQGKSATAGLSDNSALVTAVLLGIAIPPGAAWWLVVSGIFMAIALSKQAFGGLGQNPFNPAMCGYAFLLLSFPQAMTSWQIPVPGRDELGFSPLSLTSLAASLQFPFDWAPSTSSADGLAMATPLLEQKLAARNAIWAVFDSGGSWAQILVRNNETGWELVNMAYLLGGLFLLYRRIITWHIPFSIIATIVILSLLFYSPSSVNIYGTTYLHLFGTATMIGAFFIATDPVSSASTPRGKLVYGILVGIGMYSIRVWGSYLDSVAFAVLLGNFLAPLIDRATMPRIYGHAGIR